MADLSGSGIGEALHAVGELLAAEGVEIAVVVLGGAALNLLGIVERTTRDVDIVAMASGGPGSPLGPADPLPEPLERAIVRVARDLGLPQDWMNARVGLQWRAGLPPGLDQRIHWRPYDGLTVGLVDRYDLIFFKLFAAADSEGPESIHYRDLLALEPTEEELDAAADWGREQDTSPEFLAILEQVVGQARRDVS